MKIKGRKYRFVRRLARVFLGLILIFLSIVLFVRSQWGQDIIVSKAVTYITDKTNTKVEIEHLFVTFSGNIFLERLYLEDKKGDTLVYSKAVEANIPIFPLLFRNELQLKSIEWEGLKANITRSENSKKFNFNFLLEALISQDTASTATQKEPLQIEIGSFDFQDFKINYDDAFLGTESQLSLGKLHLNANKTDIEDMRFELDDVELSNSELVYGQTKPFVSEDAEETQLPYISVGSLKLVDVRANYNSLPDGIIADVTMGDFLLELPKADLSTNEIEIDLLSMDGSSVSLQIAKQESAQDSSMAGSKAPPFKWPEFVVVADKIKLSNNAIHYKSGAPESATGVFDADNISFSDFTLKTHDFKYQPENAQLKLEQLSFQDRSGFHLRNAAFDAQLNNTEASLSEVNLQTNSSVLRGDLRFQYQSIQSLLDSQEKTSIELEIPDFKFAVPDLFFFQPEFIDNDYIKKAIQKPFTGNLGARGSLNNIQIKGMQIDWGLNTSLVANGTLKHPTNIDSLSFDFDTVELKSIKEDVSKFVSEKELGLSVPETILVMANAQGNSNDLTTEILLKTPEGAAQLAGRYQNKKQIQFDGNLKMDSLRLNELLNNEDLGTLSFTMNLNASGNTLNNLNASISSDFKQLEFKSYDFSNLELQGEINNGNGDINIKFKDENLNLTLGTGVKLDTLNSEVNLDLNLIGADLYALGITKENIKVGLETKGTFNGSSDAYRITGTVENGVAVYDGKQYQMGTIALNTEIDSIRTMLTIDSDFLAGNLESNASPNTITEALAQQFKNYFSDGPTTIDKVDSVRLQLNAKLRPNPILTDVFFRGIEQLDSIVLNADFDALTKQLNAELHMPLATYRGSSIDSLNISIKGDATNLNFTAGLAALVANPIYIKKTYLEGVLKNKELLLDFLSFDQGEKVFHIASELNLAQDTTQLHINAENLILNRKEWSIPEENQISIAENFLGFKNLILSRNSQELSLNNRVDGVEKEHIGITFDNFKLQTFLGLLNPDEAIASGLVEGNLIVENPFEAAGILANFKIDSLEVMQHPLGNLSLNASSKGNASYDFNLALKDGGADAALTGDYAAAASGAKLNLNLDLNRLELKTIENFTDGALKDSHGFLSGKINLSGTTAAPAYNGTIKFNATDFNVSSLNAVFKISEETLKLDTKGLYLNNFQITDADGSDFTLDGSVVTDNILNPDFDLRLDAQKFKILNSTKEDNELFYGTASLDADVAVKGNLELPRIDGKLRIRKITDITYVVPESQLDVQERDGVVIFVNRENPDAILTRNDQEETTSFFQGVDVKAILEIADDADFQVIIDKRTGDNLKVSGDAALNLNVEPNGRINLTGRYELKSGHYETNLYNLVKRRFEINPGSTITWQGEPTDAKLDVTAVYALETSASPLMSSVTSGQDISVTGKYRQVLPFLVYLNVDGELLEPELSFGLDMPEEEQGSLSGAVYTRVQQLNQQEAELNKQVFSLLALNRFYPDAGSDGSTGGTAAIARDNVNKVLSGELNAFSDRIFGNSGFEVDFDLDSFTDYQGDSPQDRTQLNINAKKKLFNDRLIVTAGSAVDVEGSAQPGQEETPIIGNVSLEYLLTKNGRYRLRGFRKSEYQNIIDGQLIVTGVALIFNREFNKFSQLFNPIKEEAQEEGPDKNKGEAPKEKNKSKN